MLKRDSSKRYSSNSPKTYSTKPSRIGKSEIFFGNFADRTLRKRFSIKRVQCAHDKLTRQTHFTQTLLSNIAQSAYTTNPFYTNFSYHTSRNLHTTNPNYTNSLIIHRAICTRQGLLKKSMLSPYNKSILSIPKQWPSYYIASTPYNYFYPA